MPDRDDEDGIIQPLRVEQADLKGQIKLQSLRLDVMLNEITELKTESKTAFQDIRTDIRDHVADVKKDIERVSTESKASAGKMEKWIITIVGLTFSSMITIGAVVISKLF